MKFFRRLFRTLFRSGPDEHAAIRPLWHRIVEIAREKAWYTTLGVADTVPGRFDAITLVLALVLLRMEAEADLAALDGYEGAEYRRCAVEVVLGDGARVMAQAYVWMGPLPEGAEVIAGGDFAAFIAERDLRAFGEG